MSALPEFIAPGEQPFNPQHPFVGLNRLFIFRRPWQDLNPAAIRVRQILTNIERQQENFGRLGLPEEIVILDTHPNPEVMAEAYHEHGITDDDGIVEVGGDGIVSNGNIASYLAGFKGPKEHAACGNACDLAHMLFKKRDIVDNVGAMVRSRLGKLHPTEANFDEPGKSEVTTIYAQGYLSLGKLLKRVGDTVAASSTRLVTEGMSPVKRLIYEGGLTVGEIASTEGAVIIEDNYGKHRHVMSDVVFPNGNRMAKTIHFGGVNLLEPGFGRLQLKHSTKRSVAWTFMRSASGAFRHYEAGEVYEFTISTESGEDVVGQRDGESFSIKSGSTGKIHTSDLWTNQATTKRIKSSL